MTEYTSPMFPSDPDFRIERTAEEEQARAAWFEWFESEGRLITALGREHEPDDVQMPPVRLHCPAGHRLLTVRSGHEPGQRDPLGEWRESGLPEAGRAVVFESARRNPDFTNEQWRHRRRCSHNGCEKRVSSRTCEDHARGSRDLVELERRPLRWNLRCPRKGCRYGGTYTPARLFMLYVAACRAGLKEIRLPS